MVPSWLLSLSSLLLLLLVTRFLTTHAISQEMFNDIRSGALQPFRYDVTEGVRNNKNFNKWINTRDKMSGQSPLMMSVLTGRTEFVQLLLSFDEVDVGIPEKDGYTVMHGAGFQGRYDELKMLLKDRRNIDPSERHSDGFTPLHRACWGMDTRHTETVKTFILEGGVDVDEPTNSGDTCVDITGNLAT